MELSEVMKQNTFAVVGNTIDDTKYAYIIKNQLIEKGYTAYGVGKEYSSINDIEDDIDIIDLCVNPIKGIEYIKDCKKKFKCIVIQPGAESVDLISYLKENNMPYIEACVLLGMKLYKREL